MSLHQLPTSSRAPRVSIVPERFLMATLAILCAHCGKPETPTQSSPSRAPTGAIVETLADTTLATRHALVRRVYEETLGTTGGDFYTRGFPADAEHPTDWHLHQLDVGFGPQGGVHVVTVKQEGTKTYKNDMLDVEGDGRVDFVESSTSWPLKTEGTETPMMRSEKYYTVSNRTFDAYANALQQVLRVLDEEQNTQKGE